MKPEIIMNPPHSLIRGILPATTACCLLLFMRCSNLVDGGFGSETTNGRVSGRAFLSSGSPAAGALVLARRADYLAAIPAGGEQTGRFFCSCFTDTGGRFSFDSLDSGAYFIEINNGLAEAAVVKCSVGVARRAVDLGANILQKYATIKGEINIGGASNTAWYVQIFGLERCVAVDSAGTYTLADLPAGMFRFRFVCANSAVAPLIVDSVTAAAGAMTRVPAIGWKHSRQLALNTTATGANVAGVVYKFPLLIRLTEGVNFTFNEARRNGEDIRFFSPDRKALPYEIERWDSLGGHAEIWVRLDTILGNNGTQYITMQWGNTMAKDNSSGATVFDTSDGCVAVWHLNQSCGDATYNRHDGISSSATDTAGIIGYCKSMNGSDSIKIAGLLGTPPSVTLSAWARLDADSTLFGNGREILSLGDAAMIRMDYNFGGLGTMGSVHLYTHVRDTSFYNVSSGQFLKQTGWHLITFTVDQNNHTQALYIDGTNVRSESSVNSTIDYTGVGQSTYIGKHGNGKTNFNFTGKIDEVRAYRAPVSADYVKLCYMNQKMNDALIVFH